jgi:hypothetical protein
MREQKEKIKNIKYEIVYVTSEDKENPVKELLNFNS